MTKKTCFAFTASSRATKQLCVLPAKQSLQGFVMCLEKVEVEEELKDAKRQPSVVSLDHLEDSKREELQHLLNQFPALFR